MNKIDRYIFLEITKGCLLIFFIFLTISWLLQFTRLISLTNLIQVDIFTIFFLSIYLIPNLITIIMPFVIMFGLIITFLKLHKDRELISIFTLGLNIKSILNPLIFFSIIISSILIILNFYFAPKIYKDYKIKEYEIRNTINFEKIIISNFLEINQNTFLDFKKDNKKYKEFFIKFSEKNENMIYADEAKIIQENDRFIFKLFDGFKITILENNEIEKLEFDNYNLEIKNNSYEKYDNFDVNTFDIFEDLKNKNYLNIMYKVIDSFIFLFIIIFFYLNNIRNYKFNISSLIIFLIFSTFVLILNQVIKNIEINFKFNLILIIFLLFITLYYKFTRKNNAKN